jgi:hypothetical protein
MTEPSTTETAQAQPTPWIPADVLLPLVEEITRTLHEGNRSLIHRIVLVVGVDRARALLQQVLAIEAAGGRMTLDGTRRKTPGGLFISLARAQASAEERPRLCQPPRKKRPAQPGAEPPPSPAGAQPARQPPAVPAAPPVAVAKPTQWPPAPTPQPPAPPVPAPTWDEVKQLVKDAIQTIGEAKTVKITLIGRPGKVVQQPSCVVVALKGKAPPSLPKGLPAVPAQSAITWAVFITNKQWDKVKAFITQQADDQLLIEGYPLLDPKSKAAVVLATSCKSVMQERAQRAPEREANKDRV